MSMKDFDLIFNFTLTKRLTNKVSQGERNNFITREKQLTTHRHTRSDTRVFLKKFRNECAPGESIRAIRGRARGMFTFPLAIVVVYQLTSRGLSRCFHSVSSRRVIRVSGNVCVGILSVSPADFRLFRRSFHDN